MKKYLFTTLPSNDLGLLTRSLPIAYELKNRGHQIAFCNPAKAPNKVITDADFENISPNWAVSRIIAGDKSVSTFFQLLTSKHLKRDLGIIWAGIKHLKRNSTAEVWNIDHFMDLFGMWNKDSIRAHVQSMIKMINDYEPDVVIDFWNPWACIAAKASNIPLITVIQADMHPQSNGFIWWRQPSFEVPNPVSAINTILMEYQLKKIEKTGELLIGDRTLIVGMPETDPLPDTVDITYIGPILWQKRSEKLPDWIKDLNNEQPVIWIYPGNPRYMKESEGPFDSIVIIHACIEALKDMPVQVVLSTGHHSLPKTVLPLPSNFHYVPFVPGLAMADRSDLIIHHGGYGSCQTGLFTGTPALIIPTYSERESNARRIAAVNAGDFVLPTTDSTGKKKHVQAEDVYKKVKHILSNSSFTDNAKRISQKLRTYGGAANAATLIENVV